MKQFSLASCLGIAATLLFASHAYALNVTVPVGGSIQSGIDQVAAAGGGTVNLPVGTWTLTTSLQMKSNVTLNGGGSSSTIIQGPTTVYNWALITSTGEGLANMTVKHILLDGRIPKSALTLDPNATNPYGGAMGIYFATFTTNSTNIQISDVQIKNTSQGIHIKGATTVGISSCNLHENGICYWNHNMYFRRCTNITVINSKFLNSYSGDGLHTAQSGDYTNISGCTFSGNMGPGLEIQDTPTNVTVQSCTINNNKAEGLGFTGTTSTIKGNTCNNNATYGIHTYGGNGTITGNTATGNPTNNYEIHGTFTLSGNS